MNYTAVIRTLGTAGEKYWQLLKSIENQSIRPNEIIVYIAEGYSLPEETIGRERYVYVKKGMVAQRALRYDEVKTDYILFLDDDLVFPCNTVETMLRLLKEHNADVISPDIFPNAQRSLVSELMMALSGRMRGRRFDKVWGYKIMRTGGYSYNKGIYKDAYVSQTNAGACFLCKKEDFLNLHLEDELWLDSMSYALGDDQVMYYKMYLNNLKQITWYNHGFIHLDAGNNMGLEKEKMRLYSDLYFKNIFWHRFIYLPESNALIKSWSVLCILYFLLFSILTSTVRLRGDILRVKCKAIIDAWHFLRSSKYKSLPRIQQL